MKKALSVFMAILMLFAALSVGASAANTVPGFIQGSSPYHEANLVNADQAVLYFDLNGGTMRYPVTVCTLGSSTYAWETVENLTGVYWMVPNNALAGVDQTMKAGWKVSLPTVVAPAGWQFDGWYCYDTGDTYAANGTYKIKAEDVGHAVRFTAAYSPAPVEDASSNAMGILSKVLGTIIGIFLYEGDVEKGIALVTKMLGSIFA
ncbi:MAG: InlB B-repeat-containing protein [Ruminococcus sp.]|nr:InlB B-repeat-containing protein [Ruminococcus sp.]